MTNQFALLLVRFPTVKYIAKKAESLNCYNAIPECESGADIWQLDPYSHV